MTLLPRIFAALAGSLSYTIAKLLNEHLNLIVTEDERIWIEGLFLMVAFSVYSYVRDRWYKALKETLDGNPNA